jgi:hypothetical protein
LEQENTMSISGISAASAAVYNPQPPGATPATTPANTFGAAAAQTASTTPIVPVQQAAPGQQSGSAHHHHHHGGDNTSGQSFDVAQTGTNTVANILNTLV